MEHAQEKLNSEKSNKFLTQSDNLEKLSAIPEREKAYTCNVCNKNFSQRITLDRHSLLHTNKKPFSCDICKKSYYLRFDLTEHYKSHTEKVIFPCEKCNEKFSKISQLKKHSVVHLDQSFFENFRHDKASKRVDKKNNAKLKVPKKRKVDVNTSCTSKRTKKYTSQILQGELKGQNIVSEIFHSSGVVESCFNTLHNMCKQAAQFKKHSHRDNLTVQDIHRASTSKVYDRYMSSELIDLKTHIGQASKCVENEKVFYHGKCLNNSNFDILKDQIPNENLQNYFKFILESALKDDDDLFIYSLTDLKRNPYILPLLPLFIQSICNNLILLKYPQTKLQRFLKILHSLHQNPNLYFGNESLYHLVNFAISCITSNLRTTSFSPEDYFHFQKTAAEILKNIFSKDCIQLKSIYSYSLLRLGIPFKSSKQKFLSCYGVIIAVGVIGLPAIIYILELLFQNSSENLNELCGMWSKAEANMFQEKVVDTCETLLKYYLKVINLDETSVDQFSLSKNNPILSPEEVPLNKELCSSILNVYGDLLNSRFSYLKYSSDKIVSIKDFFENVLFKNYFP